MREQQAHLDDQQIQEAVSGIQSDGWGKPPDRADVSEDGAFRETPPGTQILGKRFEFPFQFRLRRGRTFGNRCNLLSRLLLARVIAPFAASGQVNSSAAALSDQAHSGDRTRTAEVERGKTQ
jgi:hypothetical protein